MPMLPLVLSLFVTQTAPVTAPSVASSPRAETRAADQAEAVVTQAFGRSATPTQTTAAPLPHAAPASSTSGSPVLAALVLAALAGGALFLRRRKTQLPGSSLLIHERVSLGPKRMLALAQWGDEMLLLGVTDSGVSLLRTQPARAPQLVDVFAPASQRPEPAAAAPGLERPDSTQHPASQAYGFEGTLQSALGEELHRGETTEGDVLLEKMRAAAVGLR